MLPRAGTERSPRGKIASGGRAKEISRLIGRSLRAVMDLSVIPEMNLVIDCDVGSASAVTTASAAIRPTSSRRPPSAPHGDHASDAIAVG